MLNSKIAEDFNICVRYGLGIVLRWQQPPKQMIFIIRNEFFNLSAHSEHHS